MATHNFIKYILVKQLFRKSHFLGDNIIYSIVWEWAAAVAKYIGSGAATSFGASVAWRMLPQQPMDVRTF